jgi:hypothetical protein
MNTSIFTRLLEQLSDSDWQAVIEGQAVLLIDDVRLELGPLAAPNALIKAAEQGGANALDLKSESIADAQAILANFYLTHPLTREGFNRQTLSLIQTHGAGAFAALTGQRPERTLFVDGGEVVAESAASPRHPYGAYCELPRPLSGDAIENAVHRWLESGEAFDRYLGMNVCRYNC